MCVPLFNNPTDFLSLFYTYIHVHVHVHVYTSTDKKEVAGVKSGEGKPRSKLRLVLKPLPNDEEDTTGDYHTKPEGTCGDRCAGGQEVTAESASERCSSQGSLFSISEDGSSSCREDAAEDQLPLPSSQGTLEHISAHF